MKQAAYWLPLEKNVSSKKWSKNSPPWNRLISMPIYPSNFFRAHRFLIFAAFLVKTVITNTLKMWKSVYKFIWSFLHQLFYKKSKKILLFSRSTKDWLTFSIRIEIEGQTRVSKYLWWWLRSWNCLFWKVLFGGDSAHEIGTFLWNHATSNRNMQILWAESPPNSTFQNKQFYERSPHQKYLETLVWPSISIQIEKVSRSLVDLEKKQYFLDFYSRLGAKTFK